LEGGVVATFALSSVPDPVLNKALWLNAANTRCAVMWTIFFKKSTVPFFQCSIWVIVENSIINKRGKFARRVAKNNLSFPERTLNFAHNIFFSRTHYS
jgi:hypothetical protein